MRVKNWTDANELRDNQGEDHVKSGISLIVHAEDMQPKKYGSLLEAAKGIGVQNQTLEYAHKKGRSLVTRRKGGVKVFFIEWSELE